MFGKLKKNKENFGTFFPPKDPYEGGVKFAEHQILKGAILEELEKLSANWENDDFDRGIRYRVQLERDLTPTYEINPIKGLNLPNQGVGRINRSMKISLELKEID